MVSRILSVAVMAAFLLNLSAASPVAPVQDTGPGGLPLVFAEDFSAGLGGWFFTDPDAWRVQEEEGMPVLELYQASRYEPPVRSPLNLALIRDLWLTDFVLEVEVRSTAREYGHRDLCFFFGWRDPARFYYAHLASAADEHANSIFLVDNQPRVSIARQRTQGTRWDEDYHTVRVVRDTAKGTIEVYFDDLENPVMTAADTSHGWGRIGVGSFDDTGRFRRVRVWGHRISGENVTDAQLLDLYRGLRVADVSDGMDAVNLAGIGLVDPEIRPLWRDLDKLDHQFRGVAVTVRYVPTNRVRRSFDSAEEFSRWEGYWYQNYSPEPFVELLKPGSVVVIDGSGDGDTGTIGSFNSLDWVRRGAVGIVTTGGVRDTDEVAKQRIPVYLRRTGRGIRPGRNEVESVNRPVQIGGVLVRPGDMVVADGDGVIVVPREHAVEVAVVARRILDADKAGRKRLYEQLGLPPDPTVLP